MARHLALLAAAACGDAPGATPDAAPPDAAPPDAPKTITGRDVLVNVVNDANRMPTVLADQPIGSLAITQRLPDRSELDVPVAADGTFAFTTPADRYRVRIVIDGGTPVDYQLAAPALDLTMRVFGRNDRAPVPAGTSLAVTATGAPVGGTAAISSTGLWTQTFRPALTPNAAFTIDWTTHGSLSGGRGLLDASKFDRLYYTVHDVAGPAPQHSIITATCSADVTLVGGAANAVSCTPAALVPDRCMHVRARFAAAAARLDSALAASAPHPWYSASWFAVAYPTPMLGPAAGPWLATFQPIAATSAHPDFDRAIDYSNPYAGHVPSVLASVARSRAYSYGTAAPTTFSSSTVQIVPARADCATPTELLSTVAIAAIPTLDGVDLGSDALWLALDPARDHELAWQIAVDGSYDYWTTRLFRVDASASNVTRTTLVRSHVTVDRKVVLDPALLVAGQSYAIQIIAMRAFPGAAAGDFRTWGFPATPYESSAIWSGVFRVTD